MVQSVKAMSKSAPGPHQHYSALSALASGPWVLGFGDASAVISPRPVIRPPRPSSTTESPANTPQEPWQKSVSSQGAPETRSGPAQREHEPHSLGRKRGRLSISCCAAEAGGASQHSPSLGLSATRGPEFLPGRVARSFPGAGRTPDAGGRRGDLLSRLPGSAWPARLLPTPASSPGIEGKGVDFQVSEGSTFPGQVSLLNF